MGRKYTMARSIYEIKAQKELEKQGWIVDNKAGMARWSKNRDYFHGFDLMAYRAGEPLRLISIKGHSGVPGAHRKFLESFSFPIGVQKEIWHYIVNTKDKRTTRAIKEIIP